VGVGGRGPTPQSPIPNPQSPIPNPHNLIYLYDYNLFSLNILY